MAGGAGPKHGPAASWRLPATFRLLQRKGPLGRRYEVHDLDGRVLGRLMLSKSPPQAEFVAHPGSDEPVRVFRIVPQEPAKTFARDFRVEGNSESVRVGSVRKKEYRSVRKEEWFLFDADGDPVGMVTKDPPRLGPAQEWSALRLFFPITYRLHWGQSIVGTIQDRTGVLLNDHMNVDLTLVRPEDLDDRLVLGAIYCVREGDRLSDLAGLKPAATPPTE